MGCVGGRRGGARGTSSVLMARVVVAVAVAGVGGGAVAVAGEEDVGFEAESGDGDGGRRWRTTLTRPPVQSSRRRT